MEKYITVLLFQGPLSQNFSICAYFLFIVQAKTLKPYPLSPLSEQEKIVCLI